jgi:hypothetical protein
MDHEFKYIKKIDNLPPPVVIDEYTLVHTRMGVMVIGPSTTVIDVSEIIHIDGKDMFSDLLFDTTLPVIYCKTYLLSGCAIDAAYDHMLMS